MRKLIFILMFLPLLGSGQIIYDNFESGAFNAGWTAYTSGTNTHACSTVAEIDGCFGMYSLVNGDADAIIELDIAGEADLYFQTFFNVDTIDYGGENHVVAAYDNASRNRRVSISLLDSASQLYLRAYIYDGLYAVGAPTAISVDTEYEVILRYYGSTSVGDTLEWWLDGVRQAGYNFSGGGVPTGGMFGVMSDHSDNYIISYFDNCGIYTSKPGSLGTPDACPSTSYPEINGVAAQAEINGVAVGSISSVNGVTW